MKVGSEKEFGAGYNVARNTIDQIRELTAGLRKFFSLACT
jgi:hypothetical protein